MKPLTIRSNVTPPPIPGTAGAAQPPPIPVRVAAPQPRSARSVWLLRTTLFVTVILSAGLIYWAYAKRLQPVTKEQRDKTSQMGRIADEIEQLRFKWGPQQIEETKAEYAAVKATLFGNEDEVLAWKKAVRAESDMRVLELQMEVGDPVPHPALTNEVSIRPVTLELWPMTILVSTNTPYSRVVNFANGMMRGGKRYELAELTVEGNSNSVGHAKATLNLFTSNTGAE